MRGNDGLEFLFDRELVVVEEYAAPGQVLVEEAVIRALGTLAQARPLGEVRVKGRKRSAMAFELTGLVTETR